MSEVAVQPGYQDKIKRVYKLKKYLNKLGRPVKPHYFHASRNCKYTLEICPKVGFSLQLTDDRCSKLALRT